MSQSQSGTAAVIKVKGVSFNYLQFLWSKIGIVRQAQEQGNFAGAMKLLASLIPYLPDSIKDTFKEKAVRIEHSMTRIRTGNVPEIKRIPDFFLRGIFKNRLLQSYGNEAFNQFMDELTTKLNKMGYMENTKIVAQGEADEEGDWIEVDQKSSRGSRKKKKSEAPSGSMD